MLVRVPIGAYKLMMSCPIATRLFQGNVLANISEQEFISCTATLTSCLLRFSPAPLADVNAATFVYKKQNQKKPQQCVAPGYGACAFALLHIFS